MFSGHLAGGTHHAFRDRGEGFCIYSDIAVAANVALRDYPALIKKILIIDLDVHQVWRRRTFWVFIHWRY